MHLSKEACDTIPAPENLIPFCQHQLGRVLLMFMPVFYEISKILEKDPQRHDGSHHGSRPHQRPQELCPALVSETLQCDFFDLWMADSVKSGSRRSEAGATKLEYLEYKPSNSSMVTRRTRRLRDRRL